MVDFLFVKITSSAGLVRSGLKHIFHLTDHSYKLLKSSLRLLVHIFLSCMTAISDTSSANSLGLQTRLSGRSFINTRNRRGPSIDPCGTPDIIGFNEEVTPFRITFCFLLKR